MNASHGQTATEIAADARRLIERHGLTLLCRHEEADGLRRVTICGLWRIERTEDGSLRVFTFDLRAAARAGAASGDGRFWIEGMHGAWPDVPLFGRPRRPGLRWAVAAVRLALQTAVESSSKTAVPATVQTLTQEITGWREMGETWRPGAIPICSMHRGGRTLRAVLFDHILDKEVISAVMAIDWHETGLVTYLVYALHRDGLLKVAREHRNLLPMLWNMEPVLWSRNDLFGRRRWVRGSGPCDDDWPGFETPAAWRWLLRAPASVVRAWTYPHVDRDPGVIDNLALAGITVRVPVVALLEVVRASRHLVELGRDERIQRLYRLFLLHCADRWRAEGHTTLKQWLSEYRPLGPIVDWLRQEGLAQGQPDRQATWASLCRRSDDWHARRPVMVLDLDGEDDEFDGRDDPDTSWPAPLPETTIDGILFRPLVTAASLRSEGRDMHQCVGDYAGYCRSGGYAVYLVTEPDGQRSTLGLTISSDRSAVLVDQHFGPCNQPVTEAARKAGRAFARRCAAGLKQQSGGGTAMTSVVICEKPSQAANVRAAIGSAHGEVLASQGHLLRLEEPGEVNPAWERWTMDVLAPPGGRYGYRPDEGGGKKPRLEAIQRALKSATRVVIATDCDREGQAIGEELLRYFGFRGEVLRAMFTAEDERTLKAAFAKLEPNARYAPLFDAAVARQQADQIFNLTMTRVSTLALRPDGHKGPIGVGRVKTPTLGIVCRREIEIREFVPRRFFEIAVTAQGEAGTVELWHRPRAEDARVFDPARVAAIQAVVAPGAPANAWRGPIGVTREHKRSAPPKPFDLPALQKAAGKWGWTAKKTLDVAQALYETHKITTYPRAETRYLPENLAAGAEALLSALRGQLPFRDSAPAEALIRKSVYSDKGLAGASHHAIVPNVNTADRFGAILPTLSDDERRLFELIARGWLAAVSPDHEFDQTVMRIAPLVDGKPVEFSVTGRVETAAGWKVVFRADADAAEEDEDEKDGEDGEAGCLPDLRDGETVAAIGCRAEAKTTEPPKRYGEGDLIDAMRNAWKFVEDPAERERLKETDGIGRPSTRDSIIEGLKGQGFLALEKKKLVPTEMGLWLYRLIQGAAPELIDCGATARMEARLGDVLHGRATADQAITETIERAGRLTGIVGAAGERTDKPKVKRSPTDGMLKAAEAKARRENVRLTRDIRTDFDACRAFLGPLPERNGEEGGLRPPSEAQIGFAQRLAGETGRELPDAVLTDARETKAWIDAALQANGPLPASEKQMEWVRKFVAEGKPAPKGFPGKVSALDAKAFLDRHFGQGRNGSARKSGRR